MFNITKINLTRPILISILLSVFFHLSVIRVLGNLYFNDSKNATSFSTPYKFSVSFAPKKSTKETSSEINSDISTRQLPTNPGIRNKTLAKTLELNTQKISKKAPHKNILPDHSTLSGQAIESGPDVLHGKVKNNQENPSESPSQDPSTATANTSDLSDSNTNKHIQNESHSHSTVFVQNIEYLEMTKPRYPPLAKRLRQEGTVKLLVLIDLEGKPKALKVQESSEHSILDKAALKAVKKWRFKPHIVGKKPVEAWAIVPIDFDLRQAQR